MTILTDNCVGATASTGNPVVESLILGIVELGTKDDDPDVANDLGHAAAPSSFVDSVSSYMLLAGLGTRVGGWFGDLRSYRPAADSSQSAVIGHDPTDAWMRPAVLP